MTALALGLVLTSALFHATWNFLSKRAGGGDAVLIWLASLVTTIVYAPIAIFILITQRPTLTWLHIAIILLSAVVHIVYFLMLTRGYQRGDLSLVYPLARGTGPLLSTVAAVILLGEQPTIVALLGATFIGIGVIILTGDPRKFRVSGAGAAVVYALLTGVTIAAYTLIDKQAVAALLIPPLLYDWVSNTFLNLLLLPHALRHRQRIAWYWREHRREVIGIGILSPFSYILILTALSFSPVSYVAPAREISILFGALLGARVLHEGDVRRRQIAAVVMVLGVVALAFG